MRGIRIGDYKDEQKVVIRIQIKSGVEVWVEIVGGGGAEERKTGEVGRRRRGE